MLGNLGKRIASNEHDLCIPGNPFDNFDDLFMGSIMHVRINEDNLEVLAANVRNDLLRLVARGHLIPLILEHLSDQINEVQILTYDEYFCLQSSPQKHLLYQISRLVLNRLHYTVDQSIRHGSVEIVLHRDLLGLEKITKVCPCFQGSKGVRIPVYYVNEQQNARRIG